MSLGLTSACGTLTAISCALTFVSMILHAVAFGSRRWIVSMENSPFGSIGFHEACFDHCTSPFCPISGDFDAHLSGCTWFWSWSFQEVWNWLLPSWFMTCRNLCIVNVPLIAVIFIVLAICTSLAFKGRYSTESNTEKVATAVQVLLFISGAMLLAACIMNMILMSSLYTHGFQRAWMPMPEKNRFGWSFWLEFVATLLMTLSFMLVITAAVLKTLWLHSDKDPRYSEDMMFGRASPAAAAPAPARTPATISLGHALQQLEPKTV